MSVPRVRFTIHRMLMIVVAGAASLLFVYRSLPLIGEFLNHDTYYQGIRTVTKTWNAGPSPSISVDVFEGSIQVLPSPDGQVRAEITTTCGKKSSQADVDRALDTVDLSLNQQGDTIRIDARGAPEINWSGLMKKQVHVKLLVPSGVRLDLRTGTGSITVGRDYNLGSPIHCPIVTSSVRARNDSRFMLGAMNGHIRVETLPVPQARGHEPIPTRLQLDAAGRIEIVADRAIVEARAWHGKPPEEWLVGSYESLPAFEGTILFEGTLAEGTHSLRAAHDLELRLKPGQSLRIDAEATGGWIEGDLVPKEDKPLEPRSTWSGTIETEPRSTLKVNVDQGSISLKSHP